MQIDYSRHSFNKLLGMTALGLSHPSVLKASTSTQSFPQWAPKAKRIIYLFQSGAPSQIDLFDYKPQLKKWYNKDLPDSIRQGQRLTGMTSNQKRFPIAPSLFDFKQHGQSGMWMSSLMPHMSKLSDDLCMIKSMHTEAINHDPAITFFQTGSQIAGRPSIGAWLSYGLGAMNVDLPASVVLTSIGTGRPAGQPLYSRLWGSGFLPSTHQGVKFRNIGDPVLYIKDPRGVDRNLRRMMLNDLNAMNRNKFNEHGDLETQTRIHQYELAYRMQESIPKLTDLSDEPESTFEAYGPESKRKGSYANNCILARRMAEQDVRCIQLFHMGWDQHFSLPKQIKGQCFDTDQATAALLKDLKQRGLLDDTLIVWGGEFGRTVYSQGALTKKNYGRDHHPRCFSMFLAGAGVKKGLTYGETDDFSYNITENPISVDDLNATILHLMGIDHKKLTVKHQGLRIGLSNIHGHVKKDLLA